MKISVVIPAFNAEKTIARAVESVLAQSRPADEIIVIDDGSKDNTADVIRAYGDKVILIQQENAGASVARNAGLKNASGDWIAFLDCDDEWLPEKLKLQSEHLARNPDLKWTYSNFFKKERIDKKFNIAHPVTDFMDILEHKEFVSDYFDINHKGVNAWTCTLVIHRNVFEKAGQFVPGMKRAQDNDMWYRIAYQFPKAGYLPQPLAIYYMDTPQSSVKINDKNDYMINIVSRHEQLSQEHGRYEAFKPCITYMLQNRIRQLLCQKRHPEIKELIERFEDYFPSRFIREMRVRLMCPCLLDPIAELIHKMKRFRKWSF